MAKILLTGGAGYIGSHVNLAFAGAGHETVVLDNLSTGFRELVVAGELIVGDLLDKSTIDRVLKEGRFDIIIHLAAKSLVGESLENPGLYWRNNIFGTRNLLDAMLEFGPGKIVFSSTAAVYGEPEKIPIPESHPLAPINPYGRTKLAIEWMILDEAKANGIDYSILRYFNAAGADPEKRVGLLIPLDPHLIPVCLDTVFGKRDKVRVFGDDYPTSDGTCIRDYIHVTDLATAHLKAAHILLDGGDSMTLNLGTGSGFSVREIIDSVQNETGQKLPVEFVERRPGDPAILIADQGNAGNILGWQPEYSDLWTVVHTAWEWRKKAESGEQ
ncbi:UDP-glucose 4-epimerase GalE [bacterium]|nr:MAG: UDP-glucose 4-epimerase GalE [bacterium]